MPFASPSSGNDLEEVRVRADLQSRGFTLIELLVVIAIMVVIAVLAIPAFTSVVGAENLTAASYQVSGAIQATRSYAMAHNTYAWLGFFEEDGVQASANPAVTGVGRIVMVAVASTDGTMVYSSSASAPLYIDPQQLTQIGKLIYIQNAHLATIATAAGATFPTRPALASANACIGITPAPNGALPYFQFPVGQSTSVAQYKFTNVLQFSPRGEVIVSNMAGVMTPLIEVDMQSAHGNVVNPNDQNTISMQVSGISGNLILYRK